jgi:hypothetical protein
MNLDRITINPVQMNGQPCIRNLRLTVRRVIELLGYIPLSVVHLPGRGDTTFGRQAFRRPFPEGLALFLTLSGIYTIISYLPGS